MFGHIENKEKMPQLAEINDVIFTCYVILFCVENRVKTE